MLCRWLYQIRVVNMKKLYKCPYSSEKNISFLLLPDKLCIHGTKIKKNNSFWFSKLILFQQMNTDWENLYFSMIFPHQMLVLFLQTINITLHLVFYRISQLSSSTVITFTFIVFLNSDRLYIYVIELQFW